MPRRRTRAECVHAPPVLYQGEIFLDWHDHRMAARPGPCRVCRRPTALLDCAGVTCHKVCAEAELTREHLAPAAQPRQRPAAGATKPARRRLVAVDGGR